MHSCEFIANDTEACCVQYSFYENLESWISEETFEWVYLSGIGLFFVDRGAIQLYDFCRFWGDAGGWNFVGISIRGQM